MKTVIPERVEIHCDFCSVLCDDASRRQKGQLVVKRDVLDMNNDPACDDTIKLDACDSCLSKVVDAINAVRVSAEK